LTTQTEEKGVTATLERPAATPVAETLAAASASTSAPMPPMPTPAAKAEKAVVLPTFYEAMSFSSYAPETVRHTRGAAGAARAAARSRGVPTTRARRHNRNTWWWLCFVAATTTHHNHPRSR
jgi:hypothetical protein